MLSVAHSPSVSSAPLSVALPLATISFFIAFASWTLFAIVGVHLKGSLGLSGTLFGLLVSWPSLRGGVLSLPLGLLAQRYGGRKVLIGSLLGLCPGLLGVILADSFWGFMLAGTGLGVAGGLFSAGLLYVSRLVPAERAGVCLGCFGAGMTGAAFTFLMVPMVHAAYDWQLAPVAYLLVTSLALVLVVAFTEPEAPEGPAGQRLWSGHALKGLWAPRIWYYCLQFMFMFGGLLALILWLPDYLTDRYQLDLQTSARLAMLFSLPGALLQVAGGSLADRWPPERTLKFALAGATLVLLLLSYPPMSVTVQAVTGPLQLQLVMPLALCLLLLMTLGGLFGLGLGSLYRLMYDDYPAHTGVVGGAVLFAGGLAAFLLPPLFGVADDLLGIPSAAFMLLFAIALSCSLAFVLSSRAAERRRLLQQSANGG